MTTNWIDANPYMTKYTLPGGSLAYHTGADLNLNTPTWDADRGRPVHASANGIVTYSNLVTTGTWGNLIVIRHILPTGKLVHTRYGHLATRAVKIGDKVTRGQIIGTIGGSQWNLPNHLHFDVSESGILETAPTHWPGLNEAAVRANYTDPKAFLRRYHPDPGGINISWHIKGDGRIYQMKVMWQGQEHSQQMQTQASSSGFYLVKNREWEQMWFSEGYVMRGIDTSPGDGAYYAQFTSPGVLGARWCPAVWKPGSTYRRNPLVVWYDKLTGQQLSGPRYDAGYRETFLKFANHFTTWRHPKGGPAFSDVIELHWLLKFDGAAAERYFYAKDYGLVGWESWNGDFSYVTEVFSPGERQPMSREEIATPWKK